MSCQVCQSVDARYRCPGCDTRTCSAACVKQHKSESGCSGERDKTAFVPLSQFDELKLLEDYAFLVETEKGIARKKRERGQELPPSQRSKIAPNLQKLVRTAAKRHSTTLLIMPPEFSRRKQNKTYCYRDGLYWTLEVVDADGSRSLVHKIGEAMLVRDALKRAGHADVTQWLVMMFVCLFHSFHYIFVHFLKFHWCSWSTCQCTPVFCCKCG